ncbi:hypothetical protein C5167_013132 [Papaver somniferum]|uniref:O-fucosyltransferase family protein n=1 Tax=Papaver somniferum TaxID=3469 RepID=A0A4Y7J3Q7_PAPSO|nr:O-fucosyltransferase 10-like isoform X2 [Papaver somniferum]RZC54285.1 hypothetical protein C5167_013132 [Papaver somniferum]
MALNKKENHQHLLLHSNSSSESNSSPSSPSCSPRRRPSSPSAPPPHYNNRTRRIFDLRKPQNRISCSFMVLIRNLRFLLVLPLLYISVFCIYVGNFADIVNQSPLPGSIYRSPEIFIKLLPQIQSDNASSLQLSSVWKYDRGQKSQKACVDTSIVQHSGLPDARGYLIVDANGGLNQQRSSICNAVAVAGILNAVLVIPRFEFHNIWQDSSDFGDIYDMDHFISTLKGHVTVIRELPKVLLEQYDYNISNILNIRVKAWAPVSYYLGEVQSVLHEKGVIRIAPFANRLAMEIPPSFQYLRCLTNYKALQFADPISVLAEQLVRRMIEKSTKTGGKYVAVHLRFEEDMVAFSCCTYDGGETEKMEMEAAREKGWRDKFKRKTYIIRPGLNRINGKCPMTPLEVGMMLRGMGFGNNTSIYLTSGKIYQAKRNLAPLLQMFPLLQTKESLATSDELAPFEGYASRLAALDYTVCLYSEVFVTTQGGNFPHFLMGHRRFLYGHAKTIKPDKGKLVLLLQNTTISWNTFKAQMEAMLAKSNREGKMLLKTRMGSRRTSVYAYPSEECMCVEGSSYSTPG